MSYQATKSDYKLNAIVQKENKQKEKEINQATLAVSLLFFGLIVYALIF